MSDWQFNMTPTDVPSVNTKSRRIVTKLPVPESLEVFKELEAIEARSMHGQIPIVWDRAEDFQVFDPYGNCWIDFTSTIFVTNSGHANPEVISELERQLKRKLLHSYTYINKPRVNFIKYLIEVTPSRFEKAFLLSAGTEATECALKLMRMHGQTFKPSKVAIISFHGSMHGRTMATEMLKGHPESSSWIGYRDPNVYHLPFPLPWTKRNDDEDYDWGKHCEEDLQKLQSEGLDFDNVAGMMIESYLGWAAALLPKDYVQTLIQYARKHNILIAFDEIQSGFGRTGKLFAYEHYNVEPDLLCLGKGLTGSLPLSAVIGPTTIMDLPALGAMSSTHSANPLSCSAALANIKSIISGNLISEAQRKGEILHQRLNQFKKKHQDRIHYILGKGLLAAIIFKNPKTQEPDGLLPSKICERAMQKGLLLVHTGRESIKIGPPLTISDEALIEGLEVLEESMNEILEEMKQEGLVR